jgi:hypothetical protein
MQAHLQVFLDAVPPQFPGGVELVMMRPQGLEPLGKILIPEGCLLLLASPEVALHMRTVMHAEIKAARERMARNGVAGRG